MVAGLHGGHIRADEDLSDVHGDLRLGSRLDKGAGVGDILDLHRVGHPSVQGLRHVHLLLLGLGGQPEFGGADSGTRCEVTSDDLLLYFIGRIHGQLGQVV